MNILVTLDRNYLPPLTVLLKSMCISNPDADFDVYVAHESLTQSDFRRIDGVIDRGRMRIHSIVVPDYSVKDPTHKKRLSVATYYRLYAPDYMPADVERYLYIDPDAIIINKLDDFYNMDMNSRTLAAAGHTYSYVEAFNKIRLGLEKGRRYINAGVILVDLKRMREYLTIDDICSYILNYRGSLLQGDQDILNTLFKHEIKIIDERLYNLDEATFKRYKKDIDLEWVRSNTVIVHYNGKNKPWNPGYKGNLQQFFYEMCHAPAPGKANG